MSQVWSDNTRILVEFGSTANVKRLILSVKRDGDSNFREYLLSYPKDAISVHEDGGDGESLIFC